jgi:hypothetical protein
MNLQNLISLVPEWQPSRRGIYRLLAGQSTDDATWDNHALNELDGGLMTPDEFYRWSSWQREKTTRLPVTAYALKASVLEYRLSEAIEQAMTLTYPHVPMLDIDEHARLPHDVFVLVNHWIDRAHYLRVQFRELVGEENPSYQAWNDSYENAALTLALYWDVPAVLEDEVL